MSNSTKRFPYFTRRRVLQASLFGAFVASISFALTRAPDFAKTAVADPARAYSPEEINDASMGFGVIGWFVSTPFSWLALALLLALLVSLKWGDSLWFPGLSLLTAVAAIVLPLVLTQTHTDSTFETWAQERYGISLESYPKDEGFFSGLKPNAKTKIRLDDGRLVRCSDYYVDSRGNAAFIIVHADADARELEVLAE